MSALRLAAHTERPAALDHAASVRDVLQASRNVTDTHQSLCECPYGNTEELLVRATAWHEAERELTRCMLRERALRMQAGGRAWLREVESVRAKGSSDV